MSDSVFKNPFDVIDNDATCDSDEYTVPMEAEQALKKIAKRGNETRSKGFRELLDTVTPLPKEHLASVALQLRSSFVSIFKKYSFEPDKNNRMALGRLLELFVSSADLKSFLAPILQDIIFLWLLAMYDPLKEVATTYRKAFDATFANAGAVEKLLTRFSSVIQEEMESYLQGRKWQSVRELTCVDLGGSEEEAAGVIELVKTELTGLSMLLASKKILDIDACAKYIVEDKFMSASRRLAVYRLYKSTKNVKFFSAVTRLIQTENSHVALAFLIDLLPEMEKITEPVLMNFLENLAEEEFKRLLAVNWPDYAVVTNGILKFASQSIISKKRFISVWKDFCGPMLGKHASNEQLSSLLFDERRPLKAIGPLSSTETVDLLVDSLPADRLKLVASENRDCCQKALLLSALADSEALNTCLSRLTLQDLQRPELAQLVSPQILATALQTTQLDSPQEVVKMLERLEPSVALDYLSTYDNVKDLVPFSSILFIKNVLLKTNTKLPVTSETVAAALESDLNCFSANEVDDSCLEAALMLCKPHWNSPLLNELIIAKRFASIEKIDDCDLLLQQLDITPDLFLYLNLQDERFFPIEAFKVSPPEEFDNIAMLMYKSRKEVRPDLEKLSQFKLLEPENVKRIALWSFLNGIPYQAPLMNAVESETVTDYALLQSGVTDFAPASFLYHYSKLKAATISEVNSSFDALLFPESGESVDYSKLALTASIEPLLPIKSDKLSVLLENCTPSEALLIMSRHIFRSDLSREFWQRLWHDRSEIILSTSLPVEKELTYRICTGFWNILESPEVEILPRLKEDLLQMKNVDCSLCFEQYGAARLFSLAIPFLGLEREVLVAAYSKPLSGPWLLALRSAFLMLFMDESLIATQTKLNADPNILEEDFECELIFPLAKESNSSSLCKQLLTLELFVSWCEGGKEDSILQSAFHKVFKSRLLSPIVAPLLQNVSKSTEVFDFTPREFADRELAEHLLYRLCTQFPLIMATLFKKVDCTEKLATRELDRIRRFGQITAENVVIKLKPVITSTTRVVNMSVNFAGEIDLEIVLHLSPAFPMEAIRVEGMKRSGLPESKWKSALLSLQAIFRSSAFNGNVVEAVRKWQANALKLFQGIEECAVCYSVVHPSDRSLPGPSCKQCKHRFHASCLYKWFKSSGNATCPLCRALF